ncbi:hypothetical protein P4O66_008005, partial [Electrophorus voltai]
MGERTLILEGLPDYLDRVKSKLELYFKNKRRSGGEILQIREDPENKRKALLIYVNEMDLKKVLEKRVHRIDFKGIGVVELTVKLLQEQCTDVERVTASVPPTSQLQTLEHSKVAQGTGDKAGTEIHKGNEKNTNALNLLISTVESIEKDTLTMYFEQFTEHVEIINHGQNSWILKLTNQTDLQKILTQEEHEFGLSVEVYKEGYVADKWDPHRFILTGFKNSCKCKLITVFIGSCSQKSDHTWELLDDDRIVVTFKEDIDAQSFLKKCASKRLQDMEIAAIQLELTDSVLVQGDMSKIKEDILNLYFSNKKRSGGGEIKSLVWVKENNSAMISFEDCYVAQQVVEQKHHLCNTELSTLLYYPCQNKGLMGKMPSLSNIPTSIIVPVEENILSFIEKNEQHKNDFQNQLKMVHANVTFDKTTSPKVIVLEMDIDKESLGALRVGLTWESKARNEALAFLSKYSMAELDLEVEGFSNTSAHPTSTASQSDTEVTVHGVLVSLKKGDITKETVDVIVNSNNISLDLNTGVSGAILSGAGKSVEDECKKHGPQKHNGVVFTSGGNLSCKHIAHMVGPKSADDIVVSIEKILNLCESNKAAKVAVPAIGTVKIAGVRIEVKKGNITNETVQGIVNTTNDQMNLKRGVSGAIFRAAGPSVEQECQKHGKLQSDTTAVTSAGNLQCDYIIHMMGPHSAVDATLRVKKVLERCEEKQIRTVSFPAVGTGGGRLKNMESITAMLQGFEEHLSMCASTAIKLIYVVIDQDEVLSEFLQGLKQWAANTQEDTDDEDGELEDEEFESCCSLDEDEEEENVGNANPTEALIGPVRVKVFCGDITKQATEAIVSSTNTSLNLRSGVSGAILKAAGQSVEEECKKFGTQPSNGVVLTKAGNLPIKNIVHMVGQTKEKEITRSMYKVLKKCEESTIQSVSFPALGTGAGNLAASQVANAMIDAVANFSIDSPIFLKSVHIVIFQQKMLQDFQEALKKFKKISLRSLGQTKQTQVGSNPVNPPLCLAAATAAVTFPVTNVEVYGLSSVDLAKTKKFLEDLISEECTSKEIQSSHLASLPKAEKEAIVALSQSNQVCVLVAAPDKLTVSGKKDDVLDAVLKINNFLQAARDRETQKGEERRLRETLCWEKAEGDAWVSLESSISYQLELAFHKKEQMLTYQEKGDTYTVDFKEMKVVNIKGNTCRIKRTLLGDSETAIIQSPPTWDKMDGRDLEIITLLEDTEEYKKIGKDFLHSCKLQNIAAVQVVQIQRIQSQRQWQRYSVLKQAVDKKYPKQKNEQFLYHGTTKDICEKINKNGFNRSFCGRNAVVHGDGTYFAKEAWYSCQDRYSNKDENGLKYIYKARVVTGLPCKSRKGMKEPDPLDPNDPKAGLYDCAVDNLQCPFIFVVFCDAGAYPDYLITFKN